jgi:hypothetical protein
MTCCTLFRLFFLLNSQQEKTELHVVLYLPLYKVVAHQYDKDEDDGQRRCDHDHQEGEDNLRSNKKFLS